MNFIDTHSHLYSSKFNEDRSEVVNEEILAGVKKKLLHNIKKSQIKSEKR